MLSESSFKAGKLLRIRLEHEAGKIKSIRITGDFFLYPEESIEELECSLKGAGLEKAGIKERVDEFLGSNVALGFDPDSLAEAIMRCAEGKNSWESGACFR